jgi:hypothetical protein
MLGFYFLILSRVVWKIPTAAPNCYLILLKSSYCFLLAIDKSTDYLILEPLNPTRNPYKIFSASVSVIPS